jgi:hypothetical protein
MQRASAGDWLISCVMPLLPEEGGGLELQRKELHEAVTAGQAVRRIRLEDESVVRNGEQQRSRLLASVGSREREEATELDEALCLSIGPLKAVHQASWQLAN